MNTRRLRWLMGSLLVGLLMISAAATLIGLARLIAATPLPDTNPATSPLLLDRHDRLLRAFTVADGRWRLPVRLDEVDPTYLALLRLIEDRRFDRHAGVDPRALARAAWQFLVNGHIVSGGSTLTMQLARLLDGGSTRHWSGKLRQIRAALALERRLGKDAILTEYLTLAPYGGNLEGVRAAALAWFGKEPRRLTAAEAALLVALPQAPESRRPDRHPQAARQARDRILERAQRAGLIDAVELDAARQTPVPTRQRPFPMLAAHLTGRLHQTDPRREVLRLTLDADQQARLERLAAERAPNLGARVSVAILVADHGSGEVLASIGSADLFDPGRQGYVDMTRAVRSPGSTLKPLIYGLAFESGQAHPESLIEDRPSGFGGYVPSNFDQTYQGTVTVRRALQSSLNVPAVKLLDLVGPARLVARMRRAGANPILPDLSAPGLAIGLGGVGVTLTDLVRIYAAIARGGTAVTLREILAGEPGDEGDGNARATGTGTDIRPASASQGDRGRNGTRVLDERAAWYLASILSGVPAPAQTAPRGIAFKTGTSYGYRDAWAIGFDGRHVVGVWAGRPDGSPVPGLAGIEAAAPLLIDAFTTLGSRIPLRPAPPGILTASSGRLPPPLRQVREARHPVGGGESAPEIAYPPDGARVDLGLARGQGMDLVLKVRGGTPPFTWFANGAPIAREPFARTARWSADGPGYVSLAVVDGRGTAARVRAFLE